MTNQLKTEKWEEEFESLWEASFDRDGNKDTFEFERLKDFIFQLLFSERKRLEKEFEKILSDKKAHYELREKLVIKEVKKDLLESLLEEIEIFKLPSPKGLHQPECVECKESKAYNAALSDFAEILRKKLDELK